MILATTFVITKILINPTLDEIFKKNCWRLQQRGWGFPSRFSGENGVSQANLHHPLPYSINEMCIKCETRGWFAPVSFLRRLRAFDGERRVTRGHRISQPDSDTIFDYICSHHYAGISKRVFLQNIYRESRTGSDISINDTFFKFFPMLSTSSGIRVFIILINGLRSTKLFISQYFSQI